MFEWLNVIALGQKNPDKAEDIVLDLSEEFQKVHVYTQKELINLQDEIDLCKAHARIIQEIYYPVFECINRLIDIP